MSERVPFPAPIGAIWICGTPDSHHLEVKLNLTNVEGQQIEIKEKHIAIPNHKKRRASQPDYFLHLYQAYTGASPSPPFKTRRSAKSDEKTEIESVRKDDVQ